MRKYGSTFTDMSVPEGEDTDPKVFLIWCEKHQCLEAFRICVVAGGGCALDRIEAHDPPRPRADGTVVNEEPDPNVN